MIVGSLFGINMWTTQSSTYTISNYAQVSTPPEVGVYWDITTLDECTHIAWGQFNVTGTSDDEKTITLYVKNEGTSNFIGYIDAVGWIPANAEGYIYLSWDFGDYPLKVGRIRTTSFTLRVDQDITYISPSITDFSFNITITVTEV